jgi:hypothetical protein
MLDRQYSLDSTLPQDYEPEPALWSAMSLTEIADRFKTDKGTLKHNYTQIYERYLKDYRTDPYQDALYKPLALLEIGVACGASLKMWSRYFPHARITGADINPLCAHVCQDYDNIEIVIADATKTKIPGQFDVILDDGSHTSHDMAETIKLHWDSLSSDGYYILEDTGCTLPQSTYKRRTRHIGEDERLIYSQIIDGFLKACDSNADVEFVHCHRQCVIIKKKAILLKDDKSTSVTTS